MAFSQVTYSAAFINSLLTKLKVGNRRGIHLNALPGRHRSRLDLKDLDIVSERLSEDFLSELTEKPEFSFEISFDGVAINDLKDKEKEELFLLARKLDNMTYESEDQFLEFGIKNFGVGYPLLVRRDANDPTKVIKAPIIIWKLEIEKSARKTNSWKLTRDENSPIVLNELLRNHILFDSQIGIDQISDEVLQDSLVDGQELAKICKDLLSQLNIRNVADNSLKVRVEKCPGKEKIETLAANDAWIQWSGVFGLYKARKESIIRRNEELLKSLEAFQTEKLELEPFQTSTVSAVETDPSKEELINTLTSNEVKLIQGPPGTGKSQALTAIITNVLDSGGRCLVVCEKKTALDVVYRNLEKTGLADYCIVIDDVNKDRAEVVKKARSRMDALGASRDLIALSGYRSGDFRKKYDKFVKMRDDFNNKHAALFSKVLGETTWKDAVGIFVRTAKKSEYKLLKDLLQYEKFLLTGEEFGRLRDLIIEADGLFNSFDCNSLTALKKLHSLRFDEKFTRAALDDLEGFCKKEIEIYSGLKEIVSQLDAGFISVGAFSVLREGDLDRGLKAFNVSLRNIESAIESLRSAIALATSVEALPLKNSITDIVKGWFDKKTKRLVEKKRDAIRSIREYNGLLMGLSDDALQTVEVSDELVVKDVLRDVCKTKVLIERSIERLISLKSLLYSITGAESLLLGLPAVYDGQETRTFLKTCNVSDYFDHLKERQGSVLLLQRELGSYECFHRWRHFELRLNEAEHSLIDCLISQNCESWEDAFISWFLYGVLSQYEKTIGSLNIHGDDLVAVSNLYEELQKDQLKKIHAFWNHELGEEKSRYDQKGNFNLLYNLRKNKISSRANPLRKIIHSNFELFTKVFPVVLTNPDAADSILPLKMGLFEAVVFDEASQLRIEDTFTSFIRGQYKFVAGDKHQMPPSNYFESVGDSSAESAATDDEVFSVEEMERELALSESLLDYANNLPDKSFSYLDYHYRSQHPALIEFSNAAFYGGNLIPFPELEEYCPIQLIQVDGACIDNKNEEEVSEVLRILNEEIHQNPKGKYPSIGIATFNLKQRNEITDALNLRSATDPVFGSKLEGIKESGFFVKNLENIQGDEMDIVIISTTYGRGADRRFSERFGPVNLERGYKLLNVLVTRAKYKIYVCTSIPKAKYGDYAGIIEASGNNRKGILYAYLAYADAVSRNDKDEISSILKNLKENSYDHPRNQLLQDTGLTESPFEQEVYEALRERFSETQVIPQYKTGGFRIDFVVTANPRVKVAIECDGKSYHSSRQAYAYDVYRQAELEKMGFKVYRIWSTKWWHNHEKEIEEMFNFINQAKVSDAP